MFLYNIFLLLFSIYFLVRCDLESIFIKFTQAPFLIFKGRHGVKKAKSHGQKLLDNKYLSIISMLYPSFQNMLVKKALVISVLDLSQYPKSFYFYDHCL